MLIALGASASSSRLPRVAGALTSLAWAYLAALGRGDSARAKKLLQTFQLTYGQYVSELPGAPAGVVVNSTFDSATRNAIMFLLASQNIGTSTTRVLPMTEAKLVPYFNTWFSSLQNEDLWYFDRLSQATSVMEIPEVLGAEVFAFVEGLEAPEPSSGSIATVPRAVPPTAGQPLPAPLPTVAQRLLEPAVSAKTDWVKPAVAVGGILALGTVGYLALRRR